MHSVSHLWLQPVQARRLSTPQVASLRCKRTTPLRLRTVRSATLGMPCTWSWILSIYPAAACTALSRYLNLSLLLSLLLSLFPGRVAPLPVSTTGLERGSRPICSGPICLGGLLEKVVLEALV
jgi:hypothetical protein